MSALLSLRSLRARFIGVVTAVVLGVCLTALLVATVMHSHPAHSAAMLIVFLTVPILLFYAGYTFAQWRKGIGKDQH